MFGCLKGGGKCGDGVVEPVKIEVRSYGTETCIAWRKRSI